MPLRVRIPIMKGLYFNKTLFGPGRGGHNRGSGGSGGGCVLIVILMLVGFWYIGQNGNSPRVQDERPAVEKAKPVARKPANQPIQTASQGGFNAWGFAAFACGLALVCSCMLVFIFRGEIQAWSEARRAQAEERRVLMAMELASRPKPVQPKPIKTLTGKVAGVTYLNRDKMSRQQVIYEWCNEGDELLWKRESNNPVDRNAVALYIQTNRQFKMVGYLEADDAAAVAPLLDAGHKALIRIIGLMGRVPGRPNIGVKIIVEIF